MEPSRSNQPTAVQELSTDDLRLIHAEIANRIADLQRQRRRRRRSPAKRSPSRPPVSLTQRLFSAARLLFS